MGSGENMNSESSPVTLFLALSDVWSEESHHRDYFRHYAWSDLNRAAAICNLVWETPEVSFKCSGACPIGESRPCFRGVPPALREKPATIRIPPSPPLARTFFPPRSSTSRLSLPPKCSSSCDWLSQKPSANGDDVSRQTKPERWGGGRRPHDACARGQRRARCVAPGARGRRFSQSPPPSA